MKKVHIFTHNDLDGAGSYLVAKWYHPSYSFTHTAVPTANAMRESIIEWLSNNSFDDYDKIYVLDLDCYGAKDLIDRENVIVIDHHKTHADSIQQEPYKYAKSIVKEYTSATLLLHHLFSKAYPDIELSKKQSLLIEICDDFDTYTLANKYSLVLNWVFYTYNDRFNSFVKRYSLGFDGFKPNELSMIKIKKNELNKIINSLDIFTGKIKEYKIACVMASSCINEVHSHLLDNYEIDISIVIMPTSERVSWRKQKDCDAPLHRIAEKICDGGGHEYAAGGKITDTFLTISKAFHNDNG